MQSPQAELRQRHVARRRRRLCAEFGRWIRRGRLADGLRTPYNAPPKRGQGRFGLSGTAMTTIIRCVVSFGRSTHALSGAVIRPTIYISGIPA
jgi:hypothetical protein